VFTEYVDTLEYLRDVLAGHYGKTLGCFSGQGGQLWDGAAWQPVTKERITAALQKGELRILICTDAASEGLNLQAAGALVSYDLPWSPSKVEQRIGRIDRIGQRGRPGVSGAPDPMRPVRALRRRDAAGPRPRPPDARGARDG
jgi:ERCC4-related helicase